MGTNRADDPVDLGLRIEGSIVLLLSLSPDAVAADDEEEEEEEEDDDDDDDDATSLSASLAEDCALNTLEASCFCSTG